ncbi:MAG: thiamine pyrophosphate-binding protein, partial [Chloroflexi bacterium]|nr:thiamine pyrophosphate-binding protein [Chloroflexota bacterium]
LGAGLAQCLGQLINVWSGGLPVVVITFHGDTGSFADRVILDLGHNVGPTWLSTPFTKANWTVIEPEGIPAAVDRAIRVASTPPIGPVHLAIYDRLLTYKQSNSTLIEDAPARARPGYPADADLEEIALALHSAERPLVYVGDGVWKSGGEAQLRAVVERFGVPVVSMGNDLRSIPVAHPQHCGRLQPAASAYKPDVIVCIGARHNGSGNAADYEALLGAKRVLAIGHDVDNLTNFPGVSHTVLADEKRALERLEALVASEYEPARYAKRRATAVELGRKMRETRRTRLMPKPAPAVVRPAVLLDALQSSLEDLGGGIVITEQFAAPLDCVSEREGGGATDFLRPAGNSEGYGMGAPIGAKLAAPDRPVVGLVGDGSVYYHDSAFWTAAHHKVPVLWVIPNNGTYGIVARSFGETGGHMSKSGKYAGVVLSGIDPLKVAEGFGVEGARVTDEAKVASEIARCLRLVERESRPYVLDVRLPLGLPDGGVAAAQFQM